MARYTINNFPHKVLTLILFITLAWSCSKMTKQEEIPPRNSFLNRVEPPNWWLGFKNEKLQLLVHHPNIGNYKPSISYNGVTIIKITKANSPNYLFIDLQIDKTAKAGKFDIEFTNNNTPKLIHTYEIKARKNAENDFIGFSNKDAVYLITPDRFANGNPKNDSISGLKETTIDRTNDYARHGGDIAGITKHLNYINDLGFTAIWSSPLLINDMEESSYHGYAITDYYKVDPRFGSLEEYKNLASKMQQKNMKLIMDQVANHCGLNHWWMQDLPFEDWVNYQQYFEENRSNWNWKTVKNSNHRRTINQDNYAAISDKELHEKGWFVATMPDLNQKNAFMANYLIQNSIWWIETLKLGGIRQDTYPYPDKNFMSNWAKAIMTEYPNFTIVGEEWSYNPLLIGYWQQGANNSDGYESNLKSSMDFAMQRTIIDALNEDEAWDKGLIKMYEGLANDFYYANPKDIMLFLDNHDMSRVFTQLKGDIPNTKMALGYMLVLPRIPQVYYGTEVLMNDFKKPGDHGLVRSDFPGGWQGDLKNAFTQESLADDAKNMQRWLTKVLQYRKKSKAIHDGKTIHFAPKDGVYVLFRSLDDEVVMHIINKNEKAVTLDLNRFKELKLTGKLFTNIITNETFTWKDSLNLSKRGSLLLTTKQ